MQPSITAAAAQLSLMNPAQAGGWIHSHARHSRTSSSGALVVGPKLVGRCLQFAIVATAYEAAKDLAIHAIHLNGAIYGSRTAS